MSDPLRDDPRAPAEFERPIDRDAKIEQLLLTGLDCYFSGQFEQAIHLWTRLLFLDRGHARARAYIERARSALAERQRESDELVDKGIAAFERGDVAAARDLLTSAVERGGPHDIALTFLHRLDRLEATAPDPGSVRRVEVRPVRGAGPGAHAVPGLAAARVSWFLVSVALVALASGALVTVRGWSWLEAWLAPRPSATEPPAVAPREPLPLPPTPEVAMERGRALFERGRLHEALTVLDTIPPGDRLGPQADSLRATIQRTLLLTVTPSPAPPDAARPSRR
jgi:hypothetical protein